MLVPFVCLLFWCEYARADSLQVWHNRNPLPTQEWLRGVAYGNGTFVAVGDRGTILNSSNGVDWAVCQAGITQYLSAITFAQDRFIAGGKAGTLLWSTNGVHWANAVSPAPVHDVDGLGYGVGTNYPGGLFVAMTSSNILSGGGSEYDLKALYSSNGVNWFSGTSLPVGGGKRPHGSITSGNNRFLVSAITFGANGAYYSITGKGWFSANGSPVGPVAFGNGLFMLAQVFQTPATLASVTSTDPSAWPAGSPGGNGKPLAACFGGGRFVVVGDFGWSGVSTNATNWTLARLSSQHTLSAVTFGNGLYVTVGQGGFVATSPDGLAWTVRTKGVTEVLNDVSPVDDGFVAAGANGAMTRSSDGVAWETVPPVTTNEIAAMLQAGGRCVAAGGLGTILSGVALTNLTVQVSGTTAFLTGLAYGAGRFVAVGVNGTILTSEDATNWIAASSGTAASLAAVEFGNGKFVAVGSNGAVLSSGDGIIWSAGVSGTARNLQGIAYGRGGFVATGSQTGGSGPYIISSAHGVIWEAGAGVVVASGTIVYGNGWFLAPVPSGPGTAFYVSSDARTWSIMVATNGVPARALAYNNGTFVGVGRFGFISQSDPIVQVEINHDGLAHLTVGGPKNATYRIESLDALSDTNLWQPLTVLSNAPYVWVDPQSPGSTNRIYRAVLLQ